MSIYRVYPNEDVYDGEFIDGLRHGEGHYRYHGGLIMKAIYLHILRSVQQYA